MSSLATPITADDWDAAFAYCDSVADFARMAKRVHERKPEDAELAKAWEDAAIRFNRVME